MLVANMTMSSAGYMDGDIASLDRDDVRAAFNSGRVRSMCTVGLITMEVVWRLGEISIRQGTTERSDTVGLWIALGVLLALLLVIVALFLYKRRSYKRRARKLEANYSNLLGFQFPPPDEYEFERHHVRYDLSDPAASLGKGQYGHVVRAECVVDTNTHGDHLSDFVGSVSNVFEGKRKKQRRLSGSHRNSLSSDLSNCGVEVLATGGRTRRATIAVKLCNHETLTADEAHAFLKEAEIMKLFRHAHVLRIVGQVVTSHPLLLLQSYLTMESSRPTLSPDGSERERPVTVRDMVTLAWQVASGLAAIAEQGVCHRDLAARNCLVKKCKPPIVKIADFGLSRVLGNGDKMCSLDGADNIDGAAYAVYHVHKAGVPLPVRWMAPETLLHMDFYLKSDVWSFGVLVGEIFAYGQTPYDGYTNNEVIESIMKGCRDAQSKDCPDELYEGLMLKCWTTKLSDRPTAAECVRILDSFRRVDDVHLHFSRRTWQHLGEGALGAVVGAVGKFKRLSSKIKHKATAKDVARGDSVGPAVFPVPHGVRAERTDRSLPPLASSIQAAGHSNLPAFDDRDIEGTDDARGPDAGYVFISASVDPNSLVAGEDVPDTPRSIATIAAAAQSLGVVDSDVGGSPISQPTRMAMENQASPHEAGAETDGPVRKVRWAQVGGEGSELYVPTWAQDMTSRELYPVSVSGSGGYEAVMLDKSERTGAAADRSTNGGGAHAESQAPAATALHGIGNYIPVSEVQGLAKHASRNAYAATTNGDYIPLAQQPGPDSAKIYAMQADDAQDVARRASHDASGGGNLVVFRRVPQRVHGVAH
eukprot:CAMPEP_0206285896 /NCGR_PEP_ID=MMETSP0106_2-20121207/328_1 /ASSEMBLY_ACC=CAM_ASM_000206 /TAXON_ID=81532 /ORGANISM="Acanthoeca-like sp., Strain 10tr" /LENGTH=815 /DNA_ID=CAMNT_0053716415 /DNA_START=63 /DNA_END=2511 /DNA_ORIENTATION=-